jgi:hypothetical protein
MECIYGMNTLTETFGYPPHVFRQLANPTKWSIYQYFSKAKFATVAAVQRKCAVSQSLASRYLRDLAAVGLLVKICVGTVRLCELNQHVWIAFENYSNAIGLEVIDSIKVSEA